MDDNKPLIIAKYGDRFAARCAKETIWFFEDGFIGTTLWTAFWGLCAFGAHDNGNILGAIFLGFLAALGCINYVLIMNIPSLIMFICYKRFVRTGRLIKLDWEFDRIARARCDASGLHVSAKTFSRRFLELRIIHDEYDALSRMLDDRWIDPDWEMKHHKIITIIGNELDKLVEIVKQDIEANKAGAKLDSELLLSQLDNRLRLQEME